MKITNVYQQLTKAEFLEAIHRDDFVEPKKGDGEYAASLQISEEAQKRFEESIIHFDRRIDLPEYCGIYKTDKNIATAVENCTKEERIYVYDIIRQNFLIGNSSSMTEEERQANIALGMKKAEYASENFIPEKYREKFMSAMNTVAKLASNGKADKYGNMDYGIGEPSYLGHGSKLVQVTNDLAVMKQMDQKSYEEYLRIGEEYSGEDRIKEKSRYMINWITTQAKRNPTIYDQYEAGNADYIKENITKKNIELPSHFKNIDVSSKENFLAGLRKFMSEQPNFMSNILNTELANRYWTK